jgi:site-specific DNA-methyltransferase (adenine-specific)
VTFQLNRKQDGVRGHDDQGGASRFFQVFDAEPPFYYCPKPTRQERDRGCDELTLSRRDRMRPDLDPDHPTGLNADPKWGPVEARNCHPTVKPVRLLEYLIQLTTLPDALVLDPFAGSGSTGVAALQLGRQFIGIELTEEYFPVLEARLADALARGPESIS